MDKDKQVILVRDSDSKKVLVIVTDWKLEDNSLLESVIIQVAKAFVYICNNINVSKLLEPALTK